MVKFNLPLLIFRLDEFEVLIPLVPEHLLHKKTKKKKLDGLDPIKKTMTLLNPGARNREARLGTDRRGAGRRGRGGGSCDTLPQVKQRTGMIIFAAAAAAGWMGSPEGEGEGEQEDEGQERGGVFARFSSIYYFSVL